MTIMVFLYPFYFFVSYLQVYLWGLFLVGWGLLIIICIKKESEKEASTIVQENIENLIFSP